MMDKLIDLINQGGSGEYDARQERGEAVAYLCNGTRFKVAATSSTTPVVGISGLPAELAGRWVTLVAADDDCHLAAASEARAWLLRKDGRMWTTHIKQSMHNYAGLGAEVTPLYAHPTPDAGRVAELEAQLAASDRHGVYLEELTDAQVDRIATLESQLAESSRCAFEYAAKVGELEAEIARRKQWQLDTDAKLDATNRQLAESRERGGRMREALAERLKNAEQAAFEAWFYKECPSGDAAAVQDKWLESDARADALAGWATAGAALAADKEQNQ